MPATKRPHNPPFPDAAALAALRARLQGLSGAEVIQRFLPERIKRGGSAREILGEVRRDLVQYARVRGRDDLAKVITDTATRGAKGLPQFNHAVDLLRQLPVPPPLIADEVERWLPARAAKVLREQGITTLAELTLRMPRSRQWWKVVPGLGPAAAGEIEAFFAANPELTERARALVQLDLCGDVAPLERQVPRRHLDGSEGRNRAPAISCAMAAENDLEAIRTWLDLHEAPATQRAYRKEAERLLLWAVVQLGKPLSSLTTEDALAYRNFLRNPAPNERWIGEHRLRTDPRWRPFTGPLTPQSTSYALTVIKNLFRWLVDQRYLMANPFSGIKKVRGSGKARELEISHSFSEAEWTLVRTIANGLESMGWGADAAQRARFLLDFSYATGLRPGELIGLKLGQIRQDGGDWWIDVVGKGAKAGTVVLPPLGLSALSQYLTRREVPLDPLRWPAQLPVVAALADDEGISATRLWAIMHRTFGAIAARCEQLEPPEPALAAKLKQASTHWMRHTHAGHALANGADLLSVRDNLRHASINTTSIYLRAEEIKRARQLGAAFSQS